MYGEMERESEGQKEEKCFGNDLGRCCEGASHSDTDLLQGWKTFSANAEILQVRKIITALQRA